MNIKKIILFIAIFYGVQNCIWSQQQLKDFNFVNTKEGISKTAVSTIIQDHYGFIWIGTNGAGLHRYDGIEYISYKHELKDSVSLSSSMIYCSYLDKSNRLWIGTENGLNLYDRELDQFKRICIVDYTKENCDLDISISSITENNEGDLFVGVFEKGLFRLNTNDFIAHHIPNVEPNAASEVLNINSLKADVDGNIYAGTNI